MLRFGRRSAAGDTAPAPPRRIRILYIVDALPLGDAAGGTEAQLAALVTHLDRSRFDPELAVFRRTRPMERLDALNCPVTALDIGALRSPVTAVKLARLAAAIRRRRIDIAHVLFPDASISAPMFCRLAGARVVGARRDMGFWYTPGALAALRISNAFVARIVTNSNAVRRNVHRKERYPLARIEVCPNGHDPARFDRPAAPGLRTALGIPADAPLVGMVANFNPWKRHCDLVEAFARVRCRHRDAALLLVGGGDAAPAMAAARRLGVERAVHVVGPVADAVPIIRHFDVGVLCSASEGSSNAVIEYLACGKPVVCTNVGGNVELVREARSGFLIRPEDVDALANRLDLLLSSPPLRISLGQEGQRAARELTVARMVDAHMALYEAVAADRANPLPGLHDRKLTTAGRADNHGNP